jgi:hypothetical protein
MMVRTSVMMVIFSRRLGELKAGPFRFVREGLLFYTSPSNISDRTSSHAGSKVNVLNVVNLKRLLLF